MISPSQSELRFILFRRVWWYFLGIKYKTRDQVLFVYFYLNENVLLNIKFNIEKFPYYMFKKRYAS